MVSCFNTAPEHFVNYDMVTVKVNILEGESFAITNGMNEEYQGGDQLTLHWKKIKTFSVPIAKSAFFSQTILGKTFKYTLVESTENDEAWDYTS